MMRVASNPSVCGICPSMRMAAYVCRRVAATASSPVDATSTS